MKKIIEVTKTTIGYTHSIVKKLMLPAIVTAVAVIRSPA